MFLIPSRFPGSLMMTEFRFSCAFVTSSECVCQCLSFISQMRTTFPICSWSLYDFISAFKKVMCPLCLQLRLTDYIHHCIHLRCSFGNLGVLSWILPSTIESILGTNKILWQWTGNQNIRSGQGRGIELHNVLKSGPLVCQHKAPRTIKCPICKYRVFIQEWVWSETELFFI